MTPPRPDGDEPSSRLRGTGRGRAVALISTVAIAAIVLGLVLSHHATESPVTPVAPQKPAHVTGYLPSFAPGICPLTDTPAPSGLAPRRPALAVKIGNEPFGARPQSGLGEADIVYDTPAEGGVMRYVAVFQCQDANAIGPTRSVRYVDWHIIRQFVHPILAYANGIIPDVRVVQATKWISSADLLTNADLAAYRTTTRFPPDNLFTSTAKLYGMFPAVTTPPPPVFEYSPTLPSSAKKIASAEINFSYDTNALWSWNGSVWMHSYAGGSQATPDIDMLTNQQVSTDNVVIEIVRYHFGRWPESPGATGDVESQTLGSGPGYVLRNGTMTPVTWHRRLPINPDTFTGASGQNVKLTPGRTWVEMLLDTTAKIPGALTFTP